MGGAGFLAGRGVAAAAALVALLAACTATPEPSPPSSAPATGSVVSPSPPAPSVSPLQIGALPPTASDLTGGVPVEVPAAPSWRIVGHMLYRAVGERVQAIHLDSGALRWQATFPVTTLYGQDNTPSVAVSSDGGTVYGLRTVTDGPTPRWQLMAADASSGEVAWTRLVSDPQQVARVDVTPSILAADSSSLVIVDDPEWGDRTAVVSLPDATVAWVDSYALSADADSVLIAGSGAHDRRTGAALWSFPGTSPVVALVAETAGSVVIDQTGDGHRLVWVDRRTGKVSARSEWVEVFEEELSCQPTLTVLACFEGPTNDLLSGYDLATGKPLWSQAADEADGFSTSFRDRLYLGADGGQEVLDARTGEVLVQGLQAPGIRFANEAGILVSHGGVEGLSWVPTTG